MSITRDFRIKSIVRVEYSARLPAKSWNGVPFRKGKPRPNTAVPFTKLRRVNVGRVYHVDHRGVHYCSFRPTWGDQSLRDAGRVALGTTNRLAQKQGADSKGWTQRPPTCS